MMRRLLNLMLLTLLTATAFAQNYGESGYDYYYDYDHRIVTRSCVSCTEDYQDLWNGDYVRLFGGYVYIYHNGKQILWGNKVWLEHTGDYTVEQSGYQYLHDSEGHRFGPWGNTIIALWNGNYVVKRSGYWYLYDGEGNRVGNIYSSEDERIKIYWNGYYVAKQGGYFYIFSPKGERINGAYSTEEPLLMNSGNFKCLKGGSYYLVDTDGRTVY